MTETFTMVILMSRALKSKGTNQMCLNSASVETINRACPLNFTFVVPLNGLNMVLKFRNSYTLLTFIIGSVENQSCHAIQ